MRQDNQIGGLNVTPLRPQRAPGDGQAPGNGGQPMLFWAERDPAMQWRATALVLLVMAPLAFFTPATFIIAAIATIASGMVGNARFLFQLTAGEMRLRAGALSPILRLPLDEIAKASVLEDPAGKFLPLAAGSGHLLIHKKDGTQLLVPGLKDVAEAAAAVDKLKRDAAPAEPALDNAA